MASEVLLSNIIPFAGSGLVGYAIGFALKKILKWMLIIVGFLAGMFFVGVQLLQKNGYVSTVNWDKLGNDTRSNIGLLMLTQLTYMDYFTRLEFLLAAAWG